MRRIGGGSIYPEYECRMCGQKLWTRKGEWTGWKEWLVTKNGKRHYKTRCNFEDSSIRKDE